MKRTSYHADAAPARGARAPLPFTLPSRKREGGSAGADGHIAGAGAKWASPAAAAPAAQGTGGTEAARPTVAYASVIQGSTVPAGIAGHPQAPLNLGARTQPPPQRSPPAQGGGGYAAAAGAVAGPVNHAGRMGAGNSSGGDAGAGVGMASPGHSLPAGRAATGVDFAGTTSGFDWADDGEFIAVRFLPTASALPDVILPPESLPDGTYGEGGVRSPPPPRVRPSRRTSQDARPESASFSRTPVSRSTVAAVHDERAPDAAHDTSAVSAEEAPQAKEKVEMALRQSDIMSKKAELAAERRRAFDLEQQEQRIRADSRLKELESRMGRQRKGEPLQSDQIASSPGKPATPKTLLRRARPEHLQLRSQPQLRLQSSAGPVPVAEAHKAHAGASGKEPVRSRLKKQRPPKKPGRDVARSIVNTCIQKAISNGRPPTPLANGAMFAFSPGENQAIPSAKTSKAGEGAAVPTGKDTKGGRKRGGRQERVKRERRAMRENGQQPLDASATGPGAADNVETSKEPEGPSIGATGSAEAAAWENGSPVQPTSFADISRAFSNHPTTIPLVGTPLVPSVHVPAMKSAWATKPSHQTSAAWGEAPKLSVSQAAMSQPATASQSLWALGAQVTTHDVWDAPAENASADERGPLQSWGASASGVAAADSTNWGPSGEAPASLPDKVSKGAADVHVEENRRSSSRRGRQHVGRRKLGGKASTNLTAGKREGAAAEEYLERSKAGGSMAAASKDSKVDGASGEPAANADGQTIGNGAAKQSGIARGGGRGRGKRRGRGRRGGAAGSGRGGMAGSATSTANAVRHSVQPQSADKKAENAM